MNKMWDKNNDYRRIKSGLYDNSFHTTYTGLMPELTEKDKVFDNTYNGKGINFYYRESTDRYVFHYKKSHHKNNDKSDELIYSDIVLDVLEFDINMLLDEAQLDSNNHAYWWTCVLDYVSEHIIKEYERGVGYTLSRYEQDMLYRTIEKGIKSIRLHKKKRDAK